MAVAKPDAYQFALEAVLRELAAMRKQLDQVVRSARRRYRAPELPAADELEDVEELELEEDPFLEDDEEE